jgi:hypothetical protein
MESMDPRFLKEDVGALFQGTVNEEANREGEEQEPLPPEEEEELSNIAGVGARNRGSPRRSWRRPSGESECGRPQVPTESRPTSGKTLLGSWP